MAAIVAFYSVHAPECETPDDAHCACDGSKLPPVYAVFDAPPDGDVREGIRRAVEAAYREACVVLDQMRQTQREDDDGLA